MTLVPELDCNSILKRDPLRISPMMRELAGCPETKKVVEVTSGWRRVIWAAGSGSAGREVDQAQCVGMLEDLWMVGVVKLAKPCISPERCAVRGGLRVDGAAPGSAIEGELEVVLCRA